MKTLLNPADRQRVVARLRTLRPEAPARWGQMTAPRMVAHMTDQMRYVLGEMPMRQRKSFLRWPVVKQLAMYWIPWPKARIRTGRELLATVPTTWEADLARLEHLLEQFHPGLVREAWPDHALFGSMTRESWGRFCYRHFEHHLTQFGV